MSADTNNPFGAAWYPGTITACKEVDEGGQYGPSRFYDVTYDDGDQAECVEDAFVFGKEDYQLEMEGQRWKGISHVVDQKSTDLWVRFQYSAFAPNG